MVLSTLLGDHHHHPRTLHLPKVKRYCPRALTPHRSPRSLSVSMSVTGWEWFSLHVGTKCSSVVTLLWNHGEHQWGEMSQTIYTHSQLSPFISNFPETIRECGELAPALRLRGPGNSALAVLPLRRPVRQIAPDNGQVIAPAFPASGINSTFYRSYNSH